MKLEHYINDFSWKVNKNTIQKINEKFKIYKEKTKTEIATVFIKHRNWRELKDIALEIFNKNWIWWKEENSWLLLIVVTWEKKIRIMTGKWMELEFPENLCRDIIENELRPLLNKSQYSEIIKVWFELSTKSRKVRKKYAKKNINNSVKTRSTYKKSKNIKINLNNNKESFDFIKFIFLQIFYFIKYWAIPLIIMWFFLTKGVLIILGLFFLLLNSFIWSKKEKHVMILLPLWLLITFIVMFSIWWQLEKYWLQWSWWNNSNSYSSDYNSSYDSYSSSDWWGGSSNGGGYGD